jgi:glycosyltransferase involved in cell wall biosynthesis
LRPRTTVDAQGFDDAQFDELGDLLLEYLDDFGIDDYLVWFCTPRPLPLLRALEPRAVIYDCMDELSAFHNAPQRIIERDRALMRRADLVFTGGPTLYEARRRLHSNVHCLPSAVDGAHFAPHAARAHDDEVERLVVEIPAPRLGFFGVIDDRFDAGLLAVLADARPHWQFVMIGPVVKIDVHDLPKRNNIHWFGQQPYERLPQFVAGWDVCLLPFALNTSTRFINPTKTLEYMAADRPVVSTPVRDVQMLYGDAVDIAADADAFIAACERRLRESDAERAERVERMQAHVRRATWSATTRAMRAHIDALPLRLQRNAVPLPEVPPLLAGRRGECGGHRAPSRHEAVADSE